MFENVVFNEKYMDYESDQFTEEFEEKPFIVHTDIPKIKAEKCTPTKSNDDTLNNDETWMPTIPFRIQYKVKDPIIILERCDKLQKPLKRTNVQDEKTVTETKNALQPDDVSKPLYIQYQPTFGNENIALPEFVLSVKAKKIVHHCTICGRQYSSNKSLQCHARRIHGGYMTSMEKTSSVNDAISCVKRKQKKRSSEKLQDSSQDGPKRICKICMGSYKAQSYNKHMHKHHFRGETKENFFLLNSGKKKPSRHANSKGNRNLDKAHSNNVNNSKTLNQSNLEKNNNNSEDEALHTRNIEEHRKLCLCGISFSNSHSLYIHGQQCSAAKNSKEPALEKDNGKSKEHIELNNPAQNSKNRINITIKRTNNSYEVIFNNKEEEKSESIDNVDMAFDTFKRYRKEDSQNQLVKATQGLLEYSREHRILKIEHVDEDSLIDIEEDSETNSCSSNISTLSNMVTNTCKTRNELRPGIIETKQVEVRFTTKDSMGHLQENVSQEPKSNIERFNFLRRRNVCGCGRKFYTRKALQVHMSKHI